MLRSCSRREKMTEGIGQLIRARIDEQQLELLIHELAIQEHAAFSKVTCTLAMLRSRSGGGKFSTEGIG